MKGHKWNCVKNTIKEFVNYRKEIKVEEEEISIVLFDTAAYTIARKVQMKDFNPDTITPKSWGGTDFFPGME